MPQLIDLSVTLEAGLPSDPAFMLPQIEYFRHSQTADQITSFFPGLTVEDLPGQEGWAIEKLTLWTHNGTHLDAPYHHHSTMNGGARAIAIDEVPLEWCFAPGVKLDFRHFPDGYVATPQDVEGELRRIGHELRALDIVLVNTAAGGRYGHGDYLARGCGLGRAATEWLLERGVRVTGTDAWSWDAPFSHTAKTWAETHDPSIIWEGHRASMTTGYCHMEKLANLDLLPSSGYQVSCFPFKIKGASAGFIRAVAILDEPEAK
ncbi:MULTISPECIES: cyclase family protein [unclassified Shinella]|uniref:cyclase family protein n=1 Tax=unclassified Shinella TaxID=2643062 RepID=UPI00225D5895|nr:MULTISPECIES: cyclase family protein [unclassified Shinella]MDC7259645.1 cyclase family protein [Shinella sp. YE25]MDC7266841.1 cyclase family protein [Shinella sp. HY16]MDC7273738.1 cyclase family protein [Shinella sp. YZ44]CAI0334241.1 putative cyclase [Rhizobiaceae bacterium]